MEKNEIVLKTPVASVSTIPLTEKMGMTFRTEATKILYGISFNIQLLKPFLRQQHKAQATKDVTKKILDSAIEY